VGAENRENAGNCRAEATEACWRKRDDHEGLLSGALGEHVKREYSRRFMLANSKNNIFLV
jgi:hypothetical protein